jgi:hypothetical protein
LPWNHEGPQLAFYGYISEWSVNYAHWTANMVPIRCVVSVTFTMLPEAGKTVAQAVWKDIQMFQGSYAVTPNVPGYTPPPGLFSPLRKS